MFRKGNAVRVSKSVLGTPYWAEGPIQNAQVDRFGRLLVEVDGDWWLAENDLENAIELLSSTKSTPCKAKATSHERAQTAHDFDKGFGIGGINRYQPTATEEMALLDAQIRYVEREEKRVREGPLPHGQLWEPCSKWGCNVEPVCVLCLHCENHCDC